MLAGLADRRVAIGRVRIAGCARDPLGLRRDVDRLLGAADIGPGRLPPSAILVVRSLGDPLPRGLDLRAATPAREWQLAATAALDDCAARAARPAAGAVGADAAAVVFADSGELLATVAIAWLRGSLATSWWWRALRIEDGAALLRTFMDAPADVPAAFELLAGHQAAAAFAVRLGPQACVALTRAVAATFGAAASAEAVLAPPPVALARGSAARGARAGGSPAPVRGRPPDAPWSGIVPAQAGLGGLAVEAQALVGLSLALRASPNAIRRPGFAAAARAWRAALAAHDPAAPPAVEANGRAHGRVLATREGSYPRDAVPAATRGSDPPRPSDGSPRPVAAAARGMVDPAGDATRPAHTPSPRRAVAAPGPAATGAPPRQAIPAAAGRPGELHDEPLALTATTALGGLFHLVFAAQQIGLYGDFSSPRRPGIALDPWDFVTLVGRRLLGRPPRDAVWALLAHLASRRVGVRPATGFRPPPVWRVWRNRLAPFAGTAGGTWRHAETGDRTLLVHPAGFTVLDAAGVDLARELRRYRIDRIRTAPTPRSADAAPLERWVEHVSGYLRARLAAALGVPPRAVAPIALMRPARVFVTATRVDVESQLADLPIEVRLAGLDRDPGFVPAAGRSLRFHFR